MRLMAVYVSFIAAYWIFRREFVACESRGVAVAFVRKVGGNLLELRWPKENKQPQTPPLRYEMTTQKMQWQSSGGGYALD
jgi:hypothetical protein